MGAKDLSGRARIINIGPTRARSFGLVGGTTGNRFGTGFGSFSFKSYPALGNTAVPGS